MYNNNINNPRNLGHSDTMFSRDDTNFNIDNLNPPQLGLNRGGTGHNQFVSVSDIGGPQL